jgi:cobalt-zinc-cadmium efflux system membrane fusion protein
VKISMPRCSTLAAVALAALMVGCGSHGASESDGEASTDAQPTVAARTATVTTRPFAVTVNAIGAVAPRPGHYAELSAPAPARIARIYVTPGQHVRKGDTLIAFERAPFDAAANGAEAALTAAQNAYGRAMRLAHDGILPQKDVDQAAATLAEAKANAVTARRAQELATLRSPLDGVVTRMSAVLSATVDANQPVIEVADPSALDIVLQLSPSQAAPVHPGDSATFTAGQDPAGEALGAGRIMDVGATVDSVSRTVAVRAHIAHPTRPLRIGETVFGQIAVAVHKNAITVPTEALVPEGDGFKVFVVDSHGIAHARPVTVGERSEGFAEITKGVRAGETVVTYGAYGVEDSSRIVPVRS